ncbi:MAG: PhnD/SsuA/transferrin family substrate-binding protein [Candidatus Thalassarchaeaceae archaeon]|nr:PhnD/SsuA/transferrin family substrate-binding protein [Candidatus Thalassarchaeaceae archaeon]
MKITHPSGRHGYSLLVLLFISAGLNGCLGGADEINGDSQKVPIVLALETDLGNVEGISDDSLLSILDFSSEFSVSTYPVDSEAAKIEALRFGHIDAALVDGATAWMGWKEYGLEVLAAEVDQQGRTHHNAHAWVRSTDPIAIAHLDGDQNTDPFELFEGRKPCFTGWPDSVGALLPMGFLLGLGYANVMGDPNDVDSLLFTIQGFFNENSMIPQPGTTYYGTEGSLRCLSEGQGDIAFLTDNAVEEICPDDDIGGNDWCLGTDDYVMLPTFGRSPSDAVLFNPDSLNEEVLATLSAVLESPGSNNPSSQDPLDAGTVSTYIITDSLQHLNGYSSLVYNVPGMQSYFSEEESQSDLDIDEVKIGLPANGFHEHQLTSISYFRESLEGKLNTNVSITYFHDIDDLIANLNSGDIHLGYFEGLDSWRAWKLGDLSVLATFQSYQDSNRLEIYPVVSNDSIAAGAHLDASSDSYSFELLRNEAVCNSQDLDTGIITLLAAYLIETGHIQPEDLDPSSTTQDIVASFFVLNNGTSNSSEFYPDRIAECFQAEDGDVAFAYGSQEGFECESQTADICFLDEGLLALPPIAEYPTPSIMYNPSNLSVVTRTTILNSLLSLNGEMYLENFTSLGRSYTGCYDISIHKVDDESPRGACGSEILKALFRSNGVSRTTTQAHLEGLNAMLSVLPEGTILA